MLVLTRKNGERVRIGEDIEITVVSVRGDQVRLGTTAPRDVGIVRAELLAQVRRENVAASRAASLAGCAGADSVAPCPSQSLKTPRSPADIKSDSAQKRPDHPIPERRLARR